MNQMRIPVRLAYDLQARLDKIEQALKTYEKIRDGLIEKYGKPSPMGGFQIAPTDKKKTAGFVKDHQDLVKIETEIEFKSIALAELEQNGIELSPAELKAIMWLLEVEPEEESQELEDL